MSDVPAAGQVPADDEPLNPQPNPEPEPDEDDLLDPDEPEPEDPDDEPAEPAPQAQPPRRGSQRVQTLANENRQHKAELAQLRQQVQGLLNQRQQPSQAEIAEANRREQEQLEMMTPVQIAAYYHQKSQNDTRALVQQAMMPILDQNDRAEYQREIEKNPRLSQFADQVEEFKRQAPGVPRRMLLATALGLRALENQGRVAGKAARNGAAGAAQHTTQPAGTRADVPAARGRRGDDLEERLRGQLI